MKNQLASASSPYLRQHASNPIHWVEWSEDAFARAREEHKLVFLSIGYSACHWCHVMAHESFEDPAVAEVLTQHFVSIKVDREERPDIDEIYMTAVQLSTGRGGWPMTLFLTPDKQPFFAGTYFPREGRGGHPGFLDLCRQIVSISENSPEGIQQAADEFGKSLREVLDRPAPPSEPLPLEPLQMLLADLSESFDPEDGGFGGAPKFPPHSSILALQRLGAGEHPMVETTLRCIAAGGIHDHVAGGFHRYSTDGYWLLPHFEKMLSDNALFLMQYSSCTESYGSRCVDGILNWVRSEMTSPEGLFYTAVDADTEGEEGLTYLWSCDEIRKLLGDRAESFIATYGMEELGNYFDEATRQKTGLNVLHLTDVTADPLSDCLAILLQARAIRPQPMVDTKCVANANGLMIEAMIRAGAGQDALQALRTWRQFERFPHQIVDGKPEGTPFLDDLLFMHSAAQLASSQLSDDQEENRAFADRLESQAHSDFLDADGRSFRKWTSAHGDLFGRARDLLDQAVPSAAAWYALARPEHAPRLIDGASAWMARVPGSTATWHAALGLLPRTPATVRRENGRSIVTVPIPPGYHMQINKGDASAMLFDDGTATQCTHWEQNSNKLFLHFDGLGDRLHIEWCTETECLAPQIVPLVESDR
ncbi:MAG: thioredoxin domain-containing protein [Chthonomonas sp.]|nr:thioredoxin domain-containing protein [Chthonomonas sp.]